MKKVTVKRSLAFIRNLLQEDPDAMEALELLTEKLEQEEWGQENRPSNPSSLDFPATNEMIANPNSFAVFSDGACRGNPGPGSWGGMGQLANGDLIFEGSGVELNTTNNRMEMEGAIWVLEQFKDYAQEHKVDLSAQVFLYSDSKYVVDGISKWVPNWKKRGWKKADNKAPENVDLWIILDEIVAEFSNLKLLWVKGHAGHPQNEYCDYLANKALDQTLL